MNKLLNIKHVHHLLELLIYTPDSIENVSDLKSFVLPYCEPKSDKECMEICLILLEYSMSIGAIKIYYLLGNGEYSKKNENIEECVKVIENEWDYLQTIRKINGEKWLIEYWIEWTDEFREELKKLDILKG
jgi:hypothetical protein